MSPSAEPNSLLHTIRQLMQQHQLDYYWVPGTDPHQSEYVPACWQRRQQLTGFTGSAGDALIGQGTADLWTDSRYWVQAEQQLSKTGFSLQQHIPQQNHSLMNWLMQNAVHKRVGVDPQLVAARQMQSLQAANVELVPIHENWVDPLLDSSLQIPQGGIEILSETEAGESVPSKVRRLWQELPDTVAAVVLSNLASIAWLFNIRGSDIPYTPVCISYAVIERKQLHWFCNAKLTERQHSTLAAQGIQIHAYDDFYTWLSQYDGTVQMDPETSSWAIHQTIRNTVVANKDPVTLLKACKNRVELSSIQQAHVEDAIALIECFAWLSEHWHGQTERSVAQKLLAFRKQQPNFQQPSFETISSFAEHGAIVHYAPTTESDRELNDQNLLLIDSGGQYHFGTTDVTRCLHFGTPTAEQQWHYTLVLKGHLALARAQFPQGTTGGQLDVLARQYLWQEALDYGHGTGHGVGCYLGVHEGPQSISPRSFGQSLLPGMVLSNEPGLYLEGQYGIRIENLCQVVSAEQKGWLTLEDLTLVPYARNLVVLSHLTQEERKQLQRYQSLIQKHIAPYLSDQASSWLFQQFI